MNNKLKNKLKTLISESMKGYSDYIEGGKTKGLTHDELVTILTNAAKGIKPGSGKNEPKKTIKEEESMEQPSVQPGAQDPVDSITLDIPLFLLLLEYAREKSEDDLDLHELSEKTNKLCKERGILTSNDYNELVDEKEDDKKEISESFRNRLRESVTNSLFKKPIKEAKKNKKEDGEKGGELESTVSVEDTPAQPEENDTPPAEGGEGENVAPQNPQTTLANQGDGKVNPQIKDIQAALTQAQVAAQALNDEKLLNQIGNTITFFTREYIVGTNQLK